MSYEENLQESGDPVNWESVSWSHLSLYLNCWKRMILLVVLWSTESKKIMEMIWFWLGICSHTCKILRLLYNFFVKINIQFVTK